MQSQTKVMQYLKSSPMLRYIVGGVVVALIVVSGVHLLGISKASPYYASGEAEKGTLSGAASILSDSNASGSKFIQFGSSSGSGGTTPQSGNRLFLLSHDWYAEGANVPWYNWQCDFGCGPSGGGVSGNTAALNTAFTSLTGAGAHVIRWWTFEGSPWQITTDSSGNPIGINPAVYTDFDAALQLAQQDNLSYDFVLFSGPAAVPSTWLTNSTQRQDLANVLGQLFAHYKNNSHILSWEIFNEPEFDIWDGKVDQTDTVDTATAIAKSVHTNAPGTLVTIGNAEADGIPMWKDVGLDYYSPHWYDYMSSGNYCMRCNDYAYYANEYGITAPIVIGETYTSSTTDALQRYTDFYNKGYAGAWSWSLFPSKTSDGLSIDLSAMKTFDNEHTDIGPQ